jgi:hypothetical protein
MVCFCHEDGSGAQAQALAPGSAKGGVHLWLAAARLYRQLGVPFLARQLPDSIRVCSANPGIGSAGGGVSCARLQCSASAGRDRDLRAAGSASSGAAELCKA